MEILSHIDWQVLRVDQLTQKFPEKSNGAAAEVVIVLPKKHKFDREQDGGINIVLRIVLRIVLVRYNLIRRTYQDNSVAIPVYIFVALTASNSDNLTQIHSLCWHQLIPAGCCRRGRVNVVVHLCL